MDNFDLKKYLVENKITTNSKMMNEYFEKETQDLAEAFAQAGIDMNTAVEVVEAGGGPGGSMGERKKMSPKALLRMLEKEKASFEEDSDEGDEVTYDFEAGEGYPDAKLAVMFSDQFEYIIYQETSSSKMMNEAGFISPEGDLHIDDSENTELGYAVENALDSRNLSDIEIGPDVFAESLLEYFTDFDPTFRQPPGMFKGDTLEDEVIATAKDYKEGAIDLKTAVSQFRKTLSNRAYYTREI